MGEKADESKRTQTLSNAKHFRQEEAAHEQLKDSWLDSSLERYESALNVPLFPTLP